MTIVQISKIIHRTGLSSDLPQLDEAELGFATDTRRLYIGNDPQLYPPDSVEPTHTEVLTEYSPISFSQIDGNDANILITNKTDGQILRYDLESDQWTNGGGNSTGNINLGHISNLSIGGGGGGFVMTTDGVGNLDWTHKGYVVNTALDISSSNPAVITTVSDHYMLNGSPMTITNIAGYVLPASLVTQSGTINTLTTSNNVSGTGTSFTSSLIGKTLVNGSNQYIGVVKSVEAADALTLEINSVITVISSAFKAGSSALNGNTYYAKVISNNTVQIFTDPALTSGFNGLTYIPYVSLSGRIVTNILAPAGGGSASGLQGEVQLNISNALGTVSTLKYNTSSNTLFSLNFSGNMVGNGSRLFSLNGSNISGAVANAQYSVNSGNSNTAITVTNPTQSNITSVGTLTSLTVGGNTLFSAGMTSNGNINIRNNSFLKGTLANSNVITRLMGIDNTNSMYIGGVDTTLADISIMNNGISAIRVDTSSNVTVARNLTVLGNIIGSVDKAISVVGNIQPNITQTGTLISLNVSGLTELNDVVVDGTLSAATINGSGSGITLINGANVVGAVPTATYAFNADTANSSAIVTNAAQPLITSVGTLTNLSVTGNEIVLGNVGIGTSNPTTKLHVVGNANIAGTVTAQTLTSSGGIIAAGANGFSSSAFVLNTRNPIWKFGNAPEYGLSYFQGTSGADGDTIGFHFGTASAANSTFQINSNSVNSAVPLKETGYRVLNANNYQSYNVYTVITADKVVARGNQNSVISNSTGGLGGVEVTAQGAGAAFMSFHRPGQWAAYFGLDTDNTFKVGGWSMGNVAYTLLHSGNYNNYSPTLTGGNASGTWNINISGNSGNSAAALSLPPETTPQSSSVKTGRNAKNGTYSYGTYSDPNAPNTYTAAIGFGKGAGGSGEISLSWANERGMWYRSLRDTIDPWTSWTRVIDSVNIHSYSPTLTGGNATGTWDINISGIASSANRLTTARSINGVFFDGTANISIPSDYKITSGSSDAADRAWYLPSTSVFSSYLDGLDLDTLISSFSNTGQFDDSKNYFFVYAPAGYTTANLVAFMPSIKKIHFSGNVDGNDSIRCEWAIHDSANIKVWVQGTEQRNFPEAHWIAIWKK